jgi:isopenicillin N synthase-like dioxygenase
MTTALRVPVVDMVADADRLDRLLGEGLERFGFVTVTNHGIPVEILHRAYDVARRTFALPETVKRQYETPANGRATGYTSFGIEHAKDDPTPDLKEFWHVRQNLPADQMLYPREIADFAATNEALFSALDGLSKRLLDAVGRHLGRPDGELSGMTRDGNSLLRILHYPPIKPGTPGLRSSAHEDINFITLLVSATAAGLEILTRDGSWLAVDNPPDAIIVNAGDMLQLLTKRRIPSTTHRVVNGDGSGERYSIPFFVHPRSEVVLSEEPLVTAGQYLNQRLEEIGIKPT